jgi:hypothetical protein
MIIMTEENSEGKGDSVLFSNIHNPNATPSVLWAGLQTWALTPT